MDKSFGSNGMLTTAIDSNNSHLFSVAMQINGEIIGAGATRINDTISNFALARYITGLNIGIIDNPVPVNSVLVFPNPIWQNATLEYALNFEETVSIRLIDMQGKAMKIFSDNQKQEAGMHKQVISLPEGLQTGTYLILISTGRKQISIKIFKY